ncbi:MAG: LytTR family transcriptional regulator [Bacteroidales bacterium]|nr:LytTR family transcriptional regulator [Bacteroidales bacterium]
MANNIIISNTTDLLRVSLVDILAIKAAGNYSVVIITDGSEHLVTYQLGQLEQLINEQLGNAASVFIRIGRGVIINQDYLFLINIPKQQLVVRSATNVQVVLTSSKDALRALKKYIEQQFKKEGINE